MRQIQFPPSIQNPVYIGKGSFGQVYKATWYQQEVALKCFSKLTYKRPAWQRETYILEELEASSVSPKFISSFETIDDYFIAMEYIPYENASTVIKNAKKDVYTEEATLRDITRQMLNFISYCHQRDIYINDIKPEHILFENPAAIRLIDMGGCRFRDEITISVGTPYYFAPEKFYQNTLHVSDIWSLGICLYKMTCGNHPFIKYPPKDMHELKDTIIDTRLDFQHEIWNHRSENMRSFIRLLLDKDWDSRSYISTLMEHPWLL